MISRPSTDDLKPLHLLVDSGSGLVSLSEQVAELAERRVLAVATHCHFDHIGSHHEFSERASHPSEAPYLEVPDRKAILIEPCATTEMFSALPPGGYDQSKYEVLPAPATHLIEDDDILDLGEPKALDGAYGVALRGQRFQECSAVGGQPVGVHRRESRAGGFA